MEKPKLTEDPRADVKARMKWINQQLDNIRVQCRGGDIYTDYDKYPPRSIQDLLKEAFGDI